MQCNVFFHVSMNAIFQMKTSKSLFSFMFQIQILCTRYSQLNEELLASINNLYLCLKNKKMITKSTFVKDVCYIGLLT